MDLDEAGEQPRRSESSTITAGFLKWGELTLKPLNRSSEHTFEPEHGAKVIENGVDVLVLDIRRLEFAQIRKMLEGQNYSVRAAHDVDDAIRLVVESQPAIMLVVWPEDPNEGLRHYQQVSQWFRGPVIGLFADEQIRAIVSALDEGLEDYLTYPVEALELSARLQVLRRRFSRRKMNRGVVNIGDLQIDMSRRRVRLNSDEIRLTRTEFEILTLLAQNHDCVVASKMILERVWGPFQHDQHQSLRVHIGHIRKKIEPAPSTPRYIITEPGIGYRLSIPGSVRPS